MKLDKSKYNIIKKFLGLILIIVILYIFKFKNKLIVISFAGDIMLSSKILERALIYENKYLVSFSFFGFLFCAILALYVKYVEDGKS